MWTAIAYTGHNFFAKDAPVCSKAKDISFRQHSQLHDL
jgi:hypothetical protein